MGRLDDAAKRKVVELRKAGLSFRKIKALLELENIKVSAQAIYLFLRDIQGRPPGRVRPAQTRGGSAASRVQGRAEANQAGIQEGWNNVHLHSLLREASQHSGLQAAAAVGFTKQTTANPDTGANASESGEISGGNRRENQTQGDKDESDIQIVSVTSLAERGQQGGIQSDENRADVGVASSTWSVPRRRVVASQTTSSMLAARRRILDKALSHRAKSIHQMTSFARRDQSAVQAVPRGVVPTQEKTYDLTSEKPVAEDQPGGAFGHRRFLTHRPILSVRSPQPPPRVGIRLSQAPPPPSAPICAAVRPQTTAGQGGRRGEGNPSPQHATGLQDQIQSLGSEVRNLGQALKMLVEHQSRLEREQAQQTLIQKQILGTLQALASKLGPGGGQTQHSKTPSPAAVPAVSASTSFRQDSFSFGQGAYSQCSQTQPGFGSMESLEHVEAFKLPALTPNGVNGFPACSSADGLVLAHSPPHSQPYAAAYIQLPPYTQSYMSTYSPSQAFRGPESKASDFPASCSAATLLDCSTSTTATLSSTHGAQVQQVNVVKVEGP